MKNTVTLIILTILAALGSLAFSACGASKPDPTPPPGVEAIQTSAVGTFAAGLTQTAISLPTNTPTSTTSFTPTSSPTSSTPRATGIGVIPTVSCYGLVLVAETIPDNAPMLPGQVFVKTWRVKNTGTCNWEAGFKFVFTSGDAMGGVTLVLGNPVSTGAEVELSIPMTAPIKTGPVQGNWRMSTASGTFFGNEVFVLINLGNATGTVTSTATATPTAGTATATSTPTNTATPTFTPTN